MQYLRPVADVSTGAWSTPLFSRLNDSDDATFTETATNDATGVVTIQTGLVPNSGTKKLVIRANKNADGGSNKSISVALLDSSGTVIQSFTTANLTGTITQYEFTVTNAISSYTGLRIRIINNHLGGIGARSTRVAEAWLEIPDGDPPSNSCPVFLLDRMDGASPGGTWEYLGYSTTEEGTPSIGDDDPGTLTGDNPEVDFEGFTPGWHHFQYCGTGCGGCEILKVQLIPGMFCTEEPQSTYFPYCEGLTGVINLYDFLDVINTNTCKIVSAVSTGLETIDSSDITVNSSVANVDLTGYSPGSYRLLIRFANVAAFDLEYDLECDSCYAEVEATFLIFDCEVCDVNAGTPLATEVCNNAVAASRALRSRLTGAMLGGSWEFLGYSATEMGTPGGGGSTPGTLTGDNPTVNFQGFTAGWYSFQYCVVNDNLEDCEDCAIVKVHVTECPCEVDAGTALEVLEICSNNESEAAVILRSRITGEDAGGVWSYLGHSATLEGTYTVGSDNPGSLAGDNPTANLLSFTSGFHKFRYCVTDASLLECSDCEDVIIQVASCSCDISAGTAETGVKACNENDSTTRSLRDHLTGETAGGSWTYIGYSVNDTTYGSGGTNPGTLTGDNPTVDFNGSVLGFYKFRYCVTDPDLIDCSDCEDLIIQVVACPCTTSAGTPQDATTCN